MESPPKQYLNEEDLLIDSFRLAATVFDSGFKPDFIVGIWRGGSSIGIYVQECLQFLGFKTDHISIRTSYQGVQSYADTISKPETIRVHGLQYLFENLNHQDNLLIVDDVFSSGQNIEAVIKRLTQQCKRNMPVDVRIAVPYYKPTKNHPGRVPDYYLHTTENWLVLPYELQGLCLEDIKLHKPEAAAILKTALSASE